MSEIITNHRSVLLNESIAALAIRPGDYFIDGTFGRGGHSMAILSRLGSEGRLLAVDRDYQALMSPEAQGFKSDSRFELVHGNFSEIEYLASERGWLGQISGILLDLGVSSPQLDVPERGFSFMRDGPLDMRMDTGKGVSAADWIAVVSEAELFRVLREYGEEKFAGRIARAIVNRRNEKPFLTTRDLASFIEKVAPTREREKHPATRSFQAIRIFINNELVELERALQQSLNVLRPGGRLVVIAFHSLEDRIVKRFMRNEERGFAQDQLRIPLSCDHLRRLQRVGKAITPPSDEISSNPRSRSAVLRVAERI